MVSDGHYDTAQICPNGHVITARADSRMKCRQEFCDKCGEATLMNCPNCKADIRGYYHVLGVSGGGGYRAPAFCHNCGSPFPWTERKKQAAIDLFNEESEDEQDRKAFQESIEQITKDTPQAQVASKRLSRLLTKVGKGTASAIRDILVDVASKAVKKILLH
jgi:hypothetical protein